VRVAQHSLVERSVILPDVDIGEGCRIRGAVVDEDVSIPSGTVIGENRQEDRRRYYVTHGGVVLVTKEMLEASQ